VLGGNNRHLRVNGAQAAAERTSRRRGSGGAASAKHQQTRSALAAAIATQRNGVARVVAGMR